MAFVEFKDVRKKYIMGEVEVLASDGLNFQIEEGEFVVIVGPSGSGKTTLLNMLGGMDRATSGQIIINGEDVTSYNEKQLTMFRRHNIGFVFQFYNLIPNLTALENVEYSNQIADNPIDAKHAMEIVDLSHRLDNFPAQLSGGEQQRVSIARAVAKNPLLLLCDEPTGALDYKTGKMVLKLLQDACRKTKKTVIIISHNQAFCEMADRVIKIKEGKVEECYTNGNPKDAKNIK